MPDFYPGTVTTITGIRRYGEVHFQPQTQTILFQKDGHWRVYRAEQLSHFNYVYGRWSHHFVAYNMPQASGEKRTVLPESLTPGASVQLLQLPNDWQWARQNELPREREGNW